MSARWARRLVCALAGAAVVMGSAHAQTGADTKASLAGRYQLEGVREVGAELVLATGHRFEFGMSYGGVDLSARGRWASLGQVVTLTTDSPPAAGFKLDRSSANLPDDYGKDPDKPTLLVVEVKTLRLDLTWSNMLVVGEFSNGRSRSGKTGDNGMVAFLDRKEPEWRGAYLQRVSVSYPKAKVDAATFYLESRSARLISIDFEPGNLVPPAFGLATFGLRGNALVQQSQEGPGKTGWVFVRK